MTMKILGVKFKNINSLPGEWEVRFDQPPLSDTGLYAIVGPNGSGKSTILDAITLGLYGETPRLRHPETGILHWQEDETYSKVTFSVGESLYQSEWWAESRAGRMQGPEMQLMSLNGQASLLEDRVIRVRSRIAELTGLDFKRFCRSILLAQGEFAEFLDALESERAEILEKIMGAEMLQELEQSIRTRAAIESEKLDKLKESAASFTLLDKSRLKQMEQEQEELSDELAQMEDAFTELQDLESWLEKLEQLQSADRRDAETLAEAEANLAKLQEPLSMLEEARRARPLEATFKRLDSLKSDQESIQSQLTQQEEKALSSEERLATLEEQLSSSLIELETAQTQKSERAEELAQASSLDREIDDENRCLTENTSQYDALENRRNDWLQRLSEVRSLIDSFQKKYQQLQQSIADQVVDPDVEMNLSAIEERLTSLEQLQQQLKGQQEERANISKRERKVLSRLDPEERAAGKLRDEADRLASRKSELVQHIDNLLGNKSPDQWASHIKDLRNKKSACRKLHKLGRKYHKQGLSGDIQGKLDKSNLEIQALEQSLSEERTHLQQFDEDIRWRDKVRGLESERSELQARQSCPLCGSLDHPFVEGGAPDFLELDRAVLAQKQKVESLEAQLDNVKATALKMKARAEEMEMMRQSLAKACFRAGVDWNLADVDVVMEESRIHARELKDARSRLRSARWQQWKLGWMDRRLDRKEARLVGKEKKAANSREQHKLESRALAAVDSQIESLQREDKKIRRELDSLLHNYREKSPAPGGEGRLLQQLRSYQFAYEEAMTTSEQLRSFEEEKTVLSTELQQSEELTTAFKQQIDEVQTRLTQLKADRMARYGDMEPISERKAMEDRIAALRETRAELRQEIQSIRQSLPKERAELAQLRETAEQIQISLEQLEQELPDQIETAGFISIDQVRELLSLLQDEQSLMEQRDAAEQALAEASSEAERVHRELESVRSESKTTDPMNVILQRIEENTQHREALQNTKEDLDRQLQENRDAERAYGETLQAIAEQEKVWAEAMEEKSMLQLPDEVETRRRVQRLMQDRLLEITNRYLASLTTRYQLRAQDSDELGFSVVDLLHGKTPRSTKTLSAGETFVVSLCLALGLSEMACKHRKIESLFLDEGFGCLDDENLYRVIATLKGLHANGKTVGVISHVKRLAEEIPTQIKLEKQPNGTCRMSIVA